MPHPSHPPLFRNPKNKSEEYKLWFFCLTNLFNILPYSYSLVDPDTPSVPGSQIISIHAISEILKG